MAIVETVGTGGIGIWNDGIAISSATTAWVNATESLAVLGQQIASTFSNSWNFLMNVFAN